ncbi:Peptidyl-tRNA hydrolase, mitochondrial [Capsicum annuum]|nr:Peptidyl-tRNA hydrolase, mitochondrial [Capsicum annuum]
MYLTQLYLTFLPEVVSKMNVMLRRICRRNCCTYSPQPWLFVGLGNPGDKYRGTRHNIGFEMLDAFANSQGIHMETVHCKAMFGKGFVNGIPVFLAKPLTYMNLSGESFHDDMDLPCGVLRLHPKGGHNRHNGLKNVIYHFRRNGEFPRLRIGIGRPPGQMDPKAFMLQKFNSTARERKSTGSSIGNSLWQKCKVRLRTIRPCGGTLPQTLRIAGALVHWAALLLMLFVYQILKLSVIMQLMQHYWKEHMHWSKSYPKASPKALTASIQFRNLRLRTIHPCGGALPSTLRIAGALVHQAALSTWWEYTGYFVAVAVAVAVAAVVVVVVENAGLLRISVSCTKIAYHSPLYDIKTPRLKKKSTLEICMDSQQAADNGLGTHPITILFFHFPGSRFTKYAKELCIEDLNLLGSSFEILSIENEGVIEEGFKKKMRELEEIFLKLNSQAEEFAPPPLSNDHGVVPISPSGEQFRFDAFNFVMQNGLADENFNRNVSIFFCFSFSSYWKTVYLQMIGSQFHFDAFKFITQNGLVDGNFNRKVLDFALMLPIL